MMSGFADIARTFKKPGLIFYMAWSDIRARYKRSVLGPIWITLSTAIGVVGLGVIWSELFHMDKSIYIPMLTIGLVFWQFMSGCIVESTTILTRQASLIRNLDLPIGLHPAQLVLRQFINLLHNLPLFFLVVLAFGAPFKASMLMAIPGVLLVAANLYWMSLLIGILGARFRDLEYFIITVMPLFMFFSPVMYRPNALPFLGKYIWINPLADMIEIVRYPLLGEMTPPFLYAINIGFLIAGGLGTALLLNAKRSRIAFWV